MRTASVVRALQFVGPLAVDNQPVFISNLSRSTSESGGHCLAFGQRCQPDPRNPPCARAHDSAYRDVAIMKKAANGGSVLNFMRFLNRDFHFDAIISVVLVNNRRVCRGPLAECHEEGDEVMNLAVFEARAPRRHVFAATRGAAAVLDYVEH